MIFQGQELEYEEIIKRAVDKFLGWQLPEDFRPDGGISFEPVGNAGTPYEFTRRPMGTNLFSGEQAEAMFRACIPREYGSAAPDPAPDREAEYRRIWLERAGAIFDKESGFASDGRCDARLAFDAADMFLAELRKRDGEGK